jgi:hypothetical protein
MNTMASLSLDSTTVTIPGLDISAKSPPLALLDNLNITVSGADPIWPINAQKMQPPPPHSSLDRYACRSTIKLATSYYEYILFMNMRMRYAYIPVLTIRIAKFCLTE